MHVHLKHMKSIVHYSTMAEHYLSLKIGLNNIRYTAHGVNYFHSYIWLDQHIFFLEQLLEWTGF
jgi:hypothetical protein